MSSYKIPISKCRSTRNGDCGMVTPRVILPIKRAIDLRVFLLQRGKECSINITTHGLSWLHCSTTCIKACVSIWLSFFLIATVMCQESPFLTNHSPCDSRYCRRRNFMAQSWTNRTLLLCVPCLDWQVLAGVTSRAELLGLPLEIYEAHPLCRTDTHRSHAGLLFEYQTAKFLDFHSVRTLTHGRGCKCPWSQDLWRHLERIGCSCLGLVKSWKREPVVKLSYKLCKQKNVPSNKLESTSYKAIEKGGWTPARHIILWINSDAWKRRQNDTNLNSFLRMDKLYRNFYVHAWCCIVVLKV